MPKQLASQALLYLSHRGRNLWSVAGAGLLQAIPRRHLGFSITSVCLGSPTHVANNLTVPATLHQGCFALGTSRMVTSMRVKETAEVGFSGT